MFAIPPFCVLVVPDSGPVTKLYDYLNIYKPSFSIRPHRHGVGSWEWRSYVYGVTREQGTLFAVCVLFGFDRIFVFFIVEITPESCVEFLLYLKPVGFNLSNLLHPGTQMQEKSVNINIMYQVLVIERTATIWLYSSEKDSQPKLLVLVNNKHTKLKIILKSLFICQIDLLFFHFFFANEHRNGL